MLVRLGSSGDAVLSIQQKLIGLGLLHGNADGSFGGGTEAAVKVFQKSQGSAPTGIVDPATWGLLLPGQTPPISALAGAPLDYRCLALTGSFETTHQPPECFSALAGDFDGQGISFGALQWNLGQGTLQGLLKDVFEQHPAVCQNIFHEHFATVKSLGTAAIGEQLAFARSVQSRGVIQEPWQGMMKALGRTKEFQDVHVAHVQDRFASALSLIKEYGLVSERAVALMFDIVTQNGGIGSIVKSQILADFAALPGGDSEVQKMRIIAKRRSAVAKPAFINDVLTRKLTIAEGHGTVHGLSYDLEDNFSLTLNPAG